MSRPSSGLNLMESLRQREHGARTVLMSDWYRIPAHAHARLETHVQECEGGPVELALQVTDDRVDLRDAARLTCVHQSEFTNVVALERGNEVRVRFFSDSLDTVDRLRLTRLFISFA